MFVKTIQIAITKIQRIFFTQKLKKMSSFYFLILKSSENFTYQTLTFFSSKTVHACRLRCNNYECQVSRTYSAYSESCQPLQPLQLLAAIFAKHSQMPERVLNTPLLLFVYHHVYINGLTSIYFDEIQKQLKKVFFSISRSSQENTCARASFFIKLQASDQQLH